MTIRCNRISANVVEVTFGIVTVLFSYQTAIACHVGGRGYFISKQHWSPTSSKHRNAWLGPHLKVATPVEQTELENLIINPERRIAA
jgi:hypothetical protein